MLDFKKTGATLPPCVVSGAQFTLGTILNVILVPSGSAKSRVPPVCRGWLSRQLEGDGLENESMQNMDVYKFFMTKHVSLAYLRG